MPSPGAAAVTDASRAVGASPAPPARDLPQRLLLGLSLAGLALLGLSGPNATAPDLHGWAPLPLHLTPVAVTALMWGALVAGAVAVWLGLRTPAPPAPRWVLALVGALALVAVPTGSADHLSYTAYGRILLLGGDPYLARPLDWASDPVVGAVEAPWREEPSVYGPVATVLHGMSAWAGQGDLRLTVLGWQLCCVLAWLAVRWLLRDLLGPQRHGRVDVVWTLNPLVVATGVAGAHVDIVAAALAVLAVWVARRSALAAGLATGLAGSTKVTYAVVGVALVGAWWLVGRGRGLAGRVGLLIAGFVLAVAPLHVWSGRHTYDQLLRSRSAVSFATPWRTLLEAGVPRGAITFGAAVLAVALALALARVTRPVGAPRHLDPSVTALWLTTVLAAAYALAAPYALPWYDLMVWAALPALAASVTDLVLLAHLWVMTMAYVPGRVEGTTPDIEPVTMGVRTVVAPLVGLALWVVVLARGLRRGAGGFGEGGFGGGGFSRGGRSGSGRESAPPPAAP